MEEKTTSTASGKESENRGVEFSEFHSGVRGTELPIDFAANSVALQGPGANLAGEGVEIGQRLSESLAAHNTDFNLSHIHDLFVDRVSALFGIYIISSGWKKDKFRAIV